MKVVGVAPPVPAWLRASLPRARRALKEEKGLAAAYIYGSSLKRRGFEDVDVALLYGGTRRPGSRKLSELALALDKAFAADVDLHVVDDLPDAVRFRVIRDGRRFLERDRLAVVRFESETLNRFLDFKAAADRFDDAVLERA